MRLQQARKDYYRRLAREEGYKSRAAYKLLEAVRKYRLIKAGDSVVDFGAAPGGWLQVACESVGEGGAVVGVDLSKIELREENLHVIQMDVNDPSVIEKVHRFVPGYCDVVLSDLSPKISGAWDLDHYKQAELTLRVIEMMHSILKKKGNAMLKLFDGERFAEVRKAVDDRFGFVSIMKPKASRRESSEMYLVCLGFSG